MISGGFDKKRMNGFSQSSSTQSTCEINFRIVPKQVIDFLKKVEIHYNRLIRNGSDLYKYAKVL